MKLLANLKSNLICKEAGREWALKSVGCEDFSSVFRNPVTQVSLYLKSTTAHNMDFKNEMINILGESTFLMNLNFFQRTDLYRLRL